MSCSWYIPAVHHLPSLTTGDHIYPREHGNICSLGHFKTYTNFVCFDSSSDSVSACTVVPTPISLLMIIPCVAFPHSRTSGNLDLRFLHPEGAKVSLVPREMWCEFLQRHGRISKLRDLIEDPDLDIYCDLHVLNVLTRNKFENKNPKHFHGGHHLTVPPSSPVEVNYSQKYERHPLMRTRARNSHTPELAF